MNSGENVHAENSAARRSPLVGNVGPAVLYISTVSTNQGGANLAFFESCLAHRRALRRAQAAHAEQGHSVDQDSSEHCS